MSTLKLNRAASKLFDVVTGIDKASGRQSTRIGFLLYLGSIHPKEATFDELVDVLEVTKSQISRTTRTLHKQSVSGEPGADLIDVSFDLRNPRIKLVSLNTKGLKVLEDSLQGYMGK